VEVITLFFEDYSALPRSQTLKSQTFPVLVPFTFEIATIEQRGKRWLVNRRPGEAQLYEERLGDALSLDMVAIPAGRFIMGSSEDEPERFSSEGPQHEVVINDFYMGRYPVTQAQWRFVASLSWINQALKPNPSEFTGDDHPVGNVSWLDAVEFCTRLSQYTGLAYSLPTEAEWEYACRAGTNTPFHFGETISSQLANYASSKIYNEGPKGEDSIRTTPIKQFNVANAFGLCDMHGNVFEWCLDHWHKNYKGAPIDSSAWLSEDENATRVARGGSWSFSPGYCRSAYRLYTSPDNRSDNVGFRVVCSVPRAQ
jgi:formylglycine-generating enzyme required for sulfatase activity